MFQPIDISTAPLGSARAATGNLFSQNPEVIVGVRTFEDRSAALVVDTTTGSGQAPGQVTVALPAPDVQELVFTELLQHRAVAPPDAEGISEAELDDWFEDVPIAGDWPLGANSRSPEGTPVIADVDQTETGNTVLRIGSLLHVGGQRSWQQTHYVVLTPHEREDLLRRLAGHS